MISLVSLLVGLQVGSWWGMTPADGLLFGGVMCVRDNSDRTIYDCSNQKIHIELDSNGAVQEISSDSATLYASIAEDISADQDCKLSLSKQTRLYAGDGRLTTVYLTTHYLCGGHTKITLTAISGPNVLRRSRLVLQPSNK